MGRGVTNAASLFTAQQLRRSFRLQERFQRFDAENPHVFTALVSIARRWKARGHKRCAIDMLFNVLRWEAGMTTRGDAFKLNNDYRSRYVRKMIASYPEEFEGFFELRELRAA